MTQTAAVSPYDGHILLDVPALNPALGYANIASALASIIQSSEPRFAVGIFGSWGSGKSTLMESLAREIDTEHAIVVTFNAWQYEREVHIVLPLLDTIREGLTAWAEAHPDARGEAATHIARAIARVVGALARGFSAKVGIPGAVELGVDAGKVLDALSAGRQDDEGSPQSMYFAAFTELRAAFQRVRTAEFSRIVVFVDDLDRCLPASALSVIESMKLFFDLPGFVFVVGMDTRVIERAVRVKFWEDFRDDGVTDVVRELEREYVNKIVQVQCTLPEMVPTQLDELLTWLDTNVRLGEQQRPDLRGRVRRYLLHVAAEGRINPRQVKRFINAYTLQRMVRPDLNPDAVLALQVFQFREDWEAVQDVLLAEPDVFLDALEGYRGREGDLPDRRALENLWPHLAVLPAELLSYLRSGEMAPLIAHRHRIDQYLSSLVSTSSTPPWLYKAFRDVGQLRQQVRDVEPGVRWASATAREAAEHMQAGCVRLGDYGANFPDVRERLAGPLERIQASIRVLSPSGQEQPRDVPAEELEVWRATTMKAIDDLQEELRLIRRSLAVRTT